MEQNKQLVDDTVVGNDAEIEDVQRQELEDNKKQEDDTDDTELEDKNIIQS